MRRREASSIHERLVGPIAAIALGTGALLAAGCGGDNADEAEPTTPVEDVIEIEIEEPTYEDPNQLTIYPNGTGKLVTLTGDEVNSSVAYYNLNCLGKVDGDLLIRTNFTSLHYGGGVSSTLVQGHPACADGEIGPDDRIYFE